MSQSDINTQVIANVRNSGFVLRLWSGDLPLVRTYWIYGCLVGVTIRLISPAITYILVANSQSLSTFDISFISYLWMSTTVLYSVFIFIAIWRSARKYAFMKPTKSGNARLAQAAVILGVIVLGTSLTKMTLNDTLLPSASNSSSLDERMQLQATLAGLNANLPRKIDDISNLNEIDFKNNSFIYYISASIIVTNKQLFIVNMQSKLKEVCNDKKLSDVLKSNINLEYVYSDTVTPKFADITIKKRSDCPNL